MYQICSIGGIHSTFEEFRKSSSLDNNGIIITDRFFGFDFEAISFPKYNPLDPYLHG